MDRERHRGESRSHVAQLNASQLNASQLNASQLNACQLNGSLQPERPLLEIRWSEIR
jgi:hypothetical protein